MEKTCEYDICTGCGACSTVCPTKCITFIEGDLGHIYPKIDQARCIDCKNCRRVCPALNEYNQKYPAAAYAGLINKKDDYLTSTSGGAAQALSIHTINQGGVVYGCASLPEAKIEHIRVDNISELKLLQGSKYVQSEAWKINTELKKDVKSGKPVLFIGTPCQCAAIKSLFKEQPENLTLVELICHGVPSQKFLRDWLIDQGINLSLINRMWFRTSEGYQLVAYKRCGEKYSPLYKSIDIFRPGCKDLYMKTFMYGYTFRPSCYKCKFARPERVADITIGDFWGLGKAGPTEENPEHKEGISVILPTTRKGIEQIEKIKDIISLYPRPIEEAIKGNHQLQHPTEYTVDKRIFNILRRFISIKKSFEISFYIKRGLRYIKKHIPE